MEEPNFFVYLHAKDSRGNSNIGQNFGRNPATYLEGFSLNQVSGRLLNWGFYLKGFKTKQDAERCLEDLRKKFPYGNGAPYRVNDRRNYPCVISLEETVSRLERYGIPADELKWG